MTAETLTTFFGWMTVLNFGVLTIATVLLLAMRDWACALHARLFGLDVADVRLTYFRWLGTYKLLTLVFAFAPWLALTIM